MPKSASVAFVLVLAVMLVPAGCSRHSNDITRNPLDGSSGQSDQDMLSRAAPSSYANCLSTPVIFAEGHGLTGEDVAGATGLRGTAGVEYFVQPYDNVTVIDGFPVYQNPSINEWQADWADGTTWGGAIPVELDWADNLTRQTWTERSKVRVEVVLSTPVEPSVHALEGYRMFSLGGTKLSEVFVTNTAKYAATSALVYSNVARLTIHKLEVKGGEPVATIYDSPCYEGYSVDGPSDAYSAEINMSGKCIYGYNWDVGAVNLAVKSGWYRLTFSLDGAASYVDELGNSHTYVRNTAISSLNPADLLGYSDPEVVLYPPTLAEGGHASALDIYIKGKSSGRR